MYYMNTPITIGDIQQMGIGLGYIVGETHFKWSQYPLYTGFDFNGKFIYTDNPKDFGDRSLHCTTKDFIKALRTFTPQSRRPMAPEVT